MNGEKGIAGHPLFKEGDRVKFRFGSEVFVGSVAIVDAWGTFFQDEEPSYDILVPSFRGSDKPVLWKHCAESNIINQERNKRNERNE